MTKAKKQRGRPFAKGNPYRFRAGADVRRHVFTPAECRRGFDHMILSIVERYPRAVTSYGAHMARRALPALLARRGR